MHLQVANRLAVRRTALAVALSVGFAGAAFAQSTTGSIFGDAPAAQGETVLIQNTTGFSREVAVDASGRFVAGSLPLGDYTVSLRQNGQTVDSRKNVTLRVGAGTQVSFAAAAAAGSADAQNLSAITVNANALPAIDVTGVDSRTVVTAEELARLPVARSAEAVALLAPGVVAGSDAYTFNNHGVVAFGGSSVGENAYYINGFNTSDPLQNIGGISLPYGSIDQQEVLSGGYGAQYGRSDGGVISQVGKRGTNDWHFGAQVQWSPKSLRAGGGDVYYVNGTRAGQIYNSNHTDKSWTTTESVYAGGPLVKDKLFFFGAYETERQQGSSVGSLAAPYQTQYKYTDPRWYAKLDWNINDSNILELTGASDKTRYDATQYNYDYATGTTGDFYGYAPSTNQGGNVYVAKYTSYVTDDLTVSAMYGKMRMNNYTTYKGYDPSVAYVSGADLQDPAITGGNGYNGNQNIGYVDPANAVNNTTNLRFDVSYHLGDHTLSAGIDNLTARAFNVGQVTSGPGYWWIYDHATDPNAPIDSAHGVNGPGGDGYFVSRYTYGARASASTVERAQYIQDSWQINDRFLLNLGLRNDQFTNYNSDSQAYIKQTSPQWAPRVGFSWDVNGDSSFKVFGNAGRYYLALPNSVAIRAAGPSVYTNEYFSYTGIDPATGAPSGLTALGPGPVSPDGETGTTPNPATVAAQGLKSEYQDEYIAGFQKQLTQDWVYGVKLTYRNLRNAIDDECDPQVLVDAAAAQGFDTSKLAESKGCKIFNPGRTNSFVLENTDGTTDTVNVSNKDFGFPDLKRKYYGAEFSLEHPFDGKWYGAFSYLYSRSYGNMEGQVRTDESQTDVSATSYWDTPELMENSNGYLANDRKHQFKIYGYYQLTDEWLVGGNIAILSGAPKSCLGSYGTDPANSDPSGYGLTSYHWCDGQPSTPGAAGRLPWQHQLSLNVEYRPMWAGKKLGFNMYVFNLLNEQRPTLLNYGYNSTNATPGSAYDRIVYRETPRYVRFGVTYDF